MKTWIYVTLATLWLVGGEAWGQEWADPVLVDPGNDTTGVNQYLSWDWCPYVTADGQYLYFASDGRPGRDNNDIYVSHWMGTAWSEPLMLPFCQLTVDERNPAANATNDTLYFISWTPGWDIYWVFRTGPCDTCWGQPERMPEPVNSSGIEFSVWCTPDNQRLLFHAIRSGTGGLEDIFQCRRDASTPTGWSAPVPLSGPLRTWDTEEYPSMGFDTTELFFHGRREQICISTLTDSGWSFGTPLTPNINRMINGHVSAETPCITPDGGRLCFASRWNGDSVATAGDIWYTERAEAINPRPSRPERLEMNIYPNPFNASATISFAVPKAGGVKVELYDLTGRLVKTVWDGRVEAGEQAVVFEGKGLSSGVYPVRVQVGGVVRVEKMMLLK